MNATQRTLLEKRGGFNIGRDPRRMSRDELIAVGHKPMSPLKALRLRCIDCCADQPSEVRLCTAVACPSWPFRMGANPWSKERSEAQQRHTRTLTEKGRSGAEKQPSGGRRSATPQVAATTLPPAKLSTNKTAVSSDPARHANIAGEGVR
jgi:hypothetical protein